MATSDEEVQARREKVEKLRQQVADAEAKRIEREQALSNDVTVAQLDAEAARLEAQLAVANDTNKAAAVKDGAAAPLEAAKEAMRLAAAQQKAQEQASKQAKTPDNEEEN